MSSRRLDVRVQKFKEEIWTEDEILESLTYSSGFRAWQKNHSRYLRQKLTDLLEGLKEQNSGTTTVVFLILKSLHHSCNPEVKTLLPLPPLHTSHPWHCGVQLWNTHACQRKMASASLLSSTSPRSTCHWQNLNCIPNPTYKSLENRVVSLQIPKI